MGFHKAFDTVHDRVLYQLDVEEAGDALAVSTTGKFDDKQPNPKLKNHLVGGNLALATRGPNNMHHLSLYDINRKDRNTTKRILLPSFASTCEGEVSSMAFSPDDNYLAIARNDNSAHVYDLRLLEKGPLYKFTHRGPRLVTPGNESYGIVKAQWVELRSIRLGLITGGHDGIHGSMFIYLLFCSPPLYLGCVKLWDPLKADISGTTLAQVESDIGHFSLGDRFRGEHDLVV